MNHNYYMAKGVIVMDASPSMLNAAKHLARKSIAAARLHSAFIFWLIVFLYAGFIVYKSNFGIIDDWWIPDTLFVGKLVPTWVIPKIGRFVILEGQEYNLLALISHKPEFFYTFNAIELILAAWLCVQTGKWEQQSKQPAIPYLVALYILFTPGFADVWLRLFIPERNELVFLLLFFLCYQRYESTGKVKYLIIGVISASLALMCKETAFILIGVFGTASIVLKQRAPIRGFMKYSFDASLVAISLLWLAAYYLIVYRFRGPLLYGARNGDYLLYVFKSIAFNTIHQPVVTLGGCMLACSAIFCARRAIYCGHLVYVILIAGLSFILTYTVLALNTNWHLLPLYTFLPYIVSQTVSNACLKRPFHLKYSFLLYALVAGQLLISVSDISVFKYAPNNFQLMLTQLVSTIKQSKAKTNIFIAGVDRSGGFELYISMESYLHYMGISESSYDLRSDMDGGDRAGFTLVTSQQKSGAFSYRKYGQIDHIEKGDVVILTPYDNINRRSEFADTSKYKLLYKTDSAVYYLLSAQSIARMSRFTSVHGNGLDTIDSNYYLYEAK